MGCDAHIFNRALVNAINWAYGPYEPGDAHIVALAHSVANMLDGERPQYRAVMQKVLAQDESPEERKLPVKCPMPVLTRWWSVLRCLEWIEDNLGTLRKVSEYVHSFYLSDSVSRKRWREVGACLQSPVLIAQLTFLVMFAKHHYYTEMAWTEQAAPDADEAGYKSHLLPARLLQRLRTLAYFKSSRREVYKAVYSAAPILIHMRIDAEMEAFHDKYIETLKKHAEPWLKPPLVVGALGDPAHSKEVAIAVAEAARGVKTTDKSELTKNIVPDSVRCMQSTLTPQWLAALDQVAITGDVNCSGAAPVQKWVQQTILSCPHHNVRVEATFNLMDEVARRGGATLTPLQKESRVLGITNTVLRDREHPMSPKTKKPKQFHYTKDNVKRAVGATATMAQDYSPQRRGDVPILPKRVGKPPATHVDEQAQSAAPARRKQFDAVKEGTDLVVPRAGIYLQ